MPTLVLDPCLEDRLRAERAESGADRWDEVWDGVYVMSPLPNNEHQVIVSKFTGIFEIVIGMPGLGTVFPGANVSDRDDWTHNYRCPDVAVFLRDGAAIDRDTFWLGGPDFAVEVVSPEERARDKISFYEAVNVRELLVVDRDPWALELFRLQEGRLAPVGVSTVEHPDLLVSTVLPLVFRLVAGEGRPRIDVMQSDGRQRWTI
jgi:Uma2 family endonuclease